jgi:hypothetical protein
MSWSVEYRDRGTGRLLETPVRSVTYSQAMLWIHINNKKDYQLGKLIACKVFHKCKK